MIIDFDIISINNDIGIDIDFNSLGGVFNLSIRVYHTHNIVL